MGKAATCLLFALTLPGWGFASDEQDGQPPQTSASVIDASASPRIRATSAATAEAIEMASERSTTFKALVATLSRTNGIVYVHEAECGRQVLACLLLMVTVAGHYRILHIKVDPRKRGIERLAALGHELQHAIEVLSDPTNTDGLAAYNFYRRESPTDKRSFETEAAIQAGLDVHAEITQWMKGKGR